MQSTEVGESGPTSTVPGDDGRTPTTVDLVVPPADTGPNRTSTTIGSDRRPGPTDDQATGGSSTGAPPTTVAPDRTPGTTVPRSPATTAASSTSPTTQASTSAPATNPPTTTLAPFTETYSSAGGSITVRWNGTSLALVSVAPAADFEAEVEDASATRVRVRFRSDGDDARIEVRVDNGMLRVDIS